MKISINAKIIDGPWGGGNKAVKSIHDYLVSRGCSVRSDLKAKDIDLILMIHPDRNLKVINFGIDEIEDYVTLHPNTLVAHRVNTSEERKGGGGETALNLKANKYVDYTVFISSYLRDLYTSRGFDQGAPYSVVLNGADEKTFHHRGSAEWDEREPLKIVTHHWSSNFMKGFDIYERVDQLLGVKPYKDLFEFCIIGNVPAGLVFKNTRVISPLHGDLLADELRKNHVYLTATRNEPAGMHHIEGMMCGLPVLYINSGALPEYCSPFGIEFTLIDFEKKLLEMREQYEGLRRKVQGCSYIASDMARKYFDIFEKLIEKRRIDPKPKPKVAAILKYYFYNRPTANVVGILRTVSKLKKLVS